MGILDKQPKCNSCGREPSEKLKNGEYWCSWCGQAFNPLEKKEKTVAKSAGSKNRKCEELSDIAELLLSNGADGRPLLPVAVRASDIVKQKGQGVKGQISP